MDAGARGRRLLQRREYAAKVSGSEDRVPDDLRDWYMHENEFLNKLGSKLKQGFKRLTSGEIMAPPITADDAKKAIKNKNFRNLGPNSSVNVNNDSYQPEGEMVEANAEQMKAMHDAKMKKKEDDMKKKKKVNENTYAVTYKTGKGVDLNVGGTSVRNAVNTFQTGVNAFKNIKTDGLVDGITKTIIDKNKNKKTTIEKPSIISNIDSAIADYKSQVGEACWKGYEKKGMKTMFGKRYPNCVKKTKKEEVQIADENFMQDKSYVQRYKKQGGYLNSPARKKADAKYAKDNPKRKPFEKRKIGTLAGNKLNDEVQYEAKKSCGEGEYYCHDMKKCKPIPDGMKVGKDGMLVKEDMKGMSQKSGDKRSTESGAGMTAQGVAKYNRRTGGNLKTAVTTPPSKLKPGSKAAKRRKSFCARSKSWTGPRGKAARRRWNCSYEPELPMIIDEKKLYNGAPLSDRVAAWARKINEGTLVRGNFGPYISGQSTKKEKKVKIDPTKPLPVAERKMTTPEKKKKEDYVKGMKKDKKGFTKRYGKDAKSVMYATATKMAMRKEGAYVTEGPFTTGAALTAAGLATWKLLQGLNTTNQMKKSIETDGTKLNTIKKANDQKNKLLQQMQTQSYEPQGEMIEAKDEKKKSVKGIAKELDKAVAMHKSQAKRLRAANVSEAKYEKGASTYGKASIRNKRMFGKGGNAAPPEERGTAIAVRRDRHVARRGIKKSNKYHEPGKHRPEVHGVNKPEQERKGKNIKEGSLHSWFKGSKSKDGKPGWVNVVTGGTCASDKPGEGTPKCVSSSKRASMSKAERLSASRRKKKADPGQQSKSGAAKPTYVATDSKKKK